MKKIILIICLFLFSCDENENIEIIDEYSLEEDINQNGGVIFTFDDRFILNWYSHRDYFITNNVKCTFFISNLHKCTQVEIDMLNTLKNDGHELGYHGTHHINANEYLSNHTLQDYLDYEILPNLSLMDSILGPPTSFAYPYGKRNDSLDLYLSDYFKIVRGTAYTPTPVNIKDLDTLFYKFNPDNLIVYAAGIDTLYNNSLVEIQDAIDRANKDKKIIIFYGHNLGSYFGQDGTYHTSFSTFNQIINQINELNMPILTISDIK